MRRRHKIALLCAAVIAGGYGFAQASMYVETLEESVSNDVLIIVGHLASVQSFDHLSPAFDSTQIKAEVKVTQVLKNITPRKVAPGDNVQVNLHLQNTTLANVTTNCEDFIWELRASDHGTLWGGVRFTNETNRLVAEIRRQERTSSNTPSDRTR